MKRSETTYIELSEINLREQCEPYYASDTNYKNMSKLVYNFEDLLIWQMAKDIVREIYLLYKDNHDYGFRDQIQRAAVSIMNNISEGFQRNKFSKDNKQFVNFLNISYGSCAEVRSMLYIAEEIGYISHDMSKSLRIKITDLEYKLEAFIKVLKNNQPSK